MAARGRGKKTARRKSPKTRSLWQMGVGWVFLSGMTQMALGSNPVEFVLGDYDLQMKEMA